ncbi:MAG: hypothetical protein PF795_05815 [Kiritimatiellae bacterium]|nr:hypothetical protein [Kiritimatiellia bacterium]
MSEVSSNLQALISKGVEVPHPASVFVDDSVNPGRIDASVTLHPGTRLLGAALSIGPESEIGGENPATVKNCQLGRGVALKGGYFEGSVFLDGSTVGSSAHVRPGCLFEEQAVAAHAVGLKQTILFPFVTLGSVINFCDVWMMGGTSRKHHSEVGSSFIHFNFTPHGDKATASLIGDVSRGVLLDQPPIFLGGQGGIVGPVEMEFGVVQAAGSISRKSLLEPDHLYQSSVPQERWQPYQTGKIRHPEEKRLLNLKYIGALSALKRWYWIFRLPLMSPDASTRHCLEGAISLLEGSLQERLTQCEKWSGLVNAQLSNEDERARWRNLPERIREELVVPVDSGTLSALVSELKAESRPYTERIQSLSADQQTVVQHFFDKEIQRFTALAVEEPRSI